MLIEITYNVTDVYMSTTETPVYVEISFEQPGSASAVWGSITGTLSNQTDLQNALNAKLDESTIDGGTEGQILSKASATDFDFAWINNYAKYLATNVRNQTGSTIGAFQVVYISGATGNKPLISLADADTEATSSKTYGVTATSIANNGTGDVVTAGELSGINTSAFNEGDLLWLSTTAGGVVTSPPAEPAHAVFIGYVVRSHPTLGTIDVSIQNGYELNELHGVQITSAANNDGLFYNSSNGLWENKSIATVLGYTPEQPLTFNSPLSRAGNIVSIPQATGSVNGFLSATDWTTFNSKENALTFSSPLVRTTNAISIPQATGSVSGFLSSTDWTTFNSKQAALGFTPANAATTLTINGVTFDLSANRSWTISTGISGSGASGQVTYWTGASAVSGSSLFTWDNTNRTLLLSGAQIYQNINQTNTTLDSAFTFLENNVIKGGIQYLGSAFSVVNRRELIEIIGRAGISFRTTIEFARFSNLGNLLLNGTTDNGQRLQVYGDTLLRGSGATLATTALTVQNSSSNVLFAVANNGDVRVGHNLDYVSTFSIKKVTDRLTFNFSNGTDADLTVDITNVGAATKFAKITPSVAIPVVISDLAGSNVVIGSTSSSASAKLQVDSTTKGFLPPRMTTTQKNAIATPAAGLVVYDTTLNKLCVYTTVWETITSI